MELFTFWLYTSIAGTVFAYALLWTIAQWLKADREVEEVEKEMVARQVQERSAEIGSPPPGEVLKDVRPGKVTHV